MMSSKKELSNTQIIGRAIEKAAKVYKWHITLFFLILLGFILGYGAGVRDALANQFHGSQVPPAMLSSGRG